MIIWYWEEYSCKENCKIVLVSFEYKSLGNGEKCLDEIVK